jgi:hypothetical protein
MHEVLHGLRPLAGQQDLSAIGLGYDMMEKRESSHDPLLEVLQHPH